MEDIQHRLDTFPTLSSEEQIAVEAYVSAHPEWADDLATGRRSPGDHAGQPS